MRSHQIITGIPAKMSPDETYNGVYLKTISIHDFSQLSKLQEQLLAEKAHITIFIIRVTSVIAKKPEESAKLINELYLRSTEIGYSVFSQGNERIIITPNMVHVEGIIQ
jgi:SepF-like predicted cell division protein (DUF552 family)